MEMLTKHKILTAVTTITAIIFAYLFAVTLFQLHAVEHARSTATSSETYLQKEEGVIAPGDKGPDATVLPVEPVLFEYIEIIDSCGVHFEGECVSVRSGPGADYPVVSRVRNHVVLRIGGKVERDGEEWYKIVFDEWIRYPERVTGDWYVSAKYARVLLSEGPSNLTKQTATTTKRIVVNRTTQTLSAYDGDTLFMQTKISTGLELTPTPRGTFTIFRKTPSRYMQGPLPGISEKYWDLPGVPWNLYFSDDGAVIHGAYWHSSFGQPWSNGCVNVEPEKAHELYKWADLGTRVIVKD